MSDYSIVALIPARGGSKRIVRKNLQKLGDHPLIAWTIYAAKASGIFSGIYVSTEDAETVAVASAYGAQVIRRPEELAADLAPDIGWVAHALTHRPIPESEAGYCKPDAFAILRVTSPFRQPATIKAAWDHLQEHGSYAVDSLRAVEPCTQHPFKMWLQAGEMIYPFVDTLPMVHIGHAPAHSMPTQTFQRFYAQNASLEMAWSWVVLDAQRPSISGDRVLPWTMPGKYESLDINSEDDLEFARYIVETGKAVLPSAT